MWKLSEWLAIGYEGGQSSEIAHAKEGMSSGDVRRTRRLVKRGGLAADVAGARLAVAQARKQQRHMPAPGSIVLLLALAAVGVWLFVEQIDSFDSGAVVLGCGALAMLWASVDLWRTHVNAPRAELANMRLLEQAGELYTPRPSRKRLPASPAQRAVSVVIGLLVYDVGYGAASLGLDGERLSIGPILERGALWSCFMVVFHLVFHQQEGREHQAPRLTAGERALMDRRLQRPTDTGRPHLESP
jgi:hypothetical protein